MVKFDGTPGFFKFLLGVFVKYLIKTESPDFPNIGYEGF